MMLSRIAESLFWIGRYIERADSMARILEVNLDLGAQSDSPDAQYFGRDLCRALGSSLPPDASVNEVWRELGLDPESQLSMVTSLTNCRESARRSREVLSTSTWEAINRSYLRVGFGRLGKLRPSLACREVRDSCAMITGTFEETMTRDEAWQFLIAGRMMERADMTARLLYATVVAPDRPTHHDLILQACGAQQSFIVTRAREDNLPAAVDFLLRDRLSPRSIFHCIEQAQDALEKISPVRQRTGFDDEAQRVLGRTAATIEYTPFSDDLSSLPDVLSGVQETVTSASQELTTRFFEGALVSQWNER